MKPLDIVGACVHCHRGYVAFVAGARCLACRGCVKAIKPVPGDYERSGKGWRPLPAHLVVFDTPER